MSFLVQQGYGKSDKINLLAGAGAAGVILSPAHEDCETLAATANGAASKDLEILMDPQSYIYSMTPLGMGKNHESHKIEFPKMHWAQSAGTTEFQVEQVGAANLRLGIRGPKIAPSPFQESFADVWSPLSLQLARTASANWGPKDTIATIAVDEHAFDNWAAVANWLDVATSIDLQGFYLLVARARAPYPSVPWKPERLANVLRFIYSLSVINEYRLIWGYADLDGLVGLSAGATSMASGWSYSLRSFDPLRWQPSTSSGGKPAVPRVHLDRIWAPVRAEDEGAAIYRSSLRDEIFHGDLGVKFPNADRFSTWTSKDAQVQHLSIFARRSNRLASETVEERLKLTSRSLDAAADRLGKLKSDGVALPAGYATRVDSFRQALELFVAAENL